MQKSLVVGKWSAYSGGSKQPLAQQNKNMTTLNSSILKSAIGSETYTALVSVWPAIVAMKRAVAAADYLTVSVCDKFETQLAAMHPLLGGAKWGASEDASATIIRSDAFLSIA